MKIDEVVGGYIALRDEKEAKNKAHKEVMAAYDAKLDKIEAALLKLFHEAGLDSVKTKEGTAYTATRTSASIADRSLFMDHIKDSGDWFLLEARVNKTGVEQYSAAHEGVLPPGVNVRSETVVNVRRS